MANYTCATLYYPSKDIGLTPQTLERVKARAAALGITDVVVASTGGSTGAQAATALEGCRVVAVTHAAGLGVPGLKIQAEHRATIEAAGGVVLAATHAFGGVSNVRAGGVGDIVANTLRCFSQGMKVAVEIAIMAADAGLISCDQEVIAVGGSGRGADTAIVVKPATSGNLFSLDVREILCMPREIEYRRTGEPLIYGSGEFTYELLPDWAQWPSDWRHGQVTGAATDSQDRVYVLNRSDHPVVVFNRDGSFIKTFGEGLFGRAHGCTVDSNDLIWCTDDLDHVILAFDADGNLVEQMGTRGVCSPSGIDPSLGFAESFDAIIEPAPPFNRPTKLAFAPTGERFVSDGYGNAAAHRFTAEGELITTWGGGGTATGRFRLPHGIWVDGENRAWVADRENHRVQLFDKNGTFIREWPNRLRPAEVYGDAEGHIYFGEIDGMVTVLDMDGNILAEVGHAYSPIRAHSIWGDSHGDLYFGTLGRGTGLYKLVKQG